MVSRFFSLNQLYHPPPHDKQGAFALLNSLKKVKIAEPLKKMPRGYGIVIEKK